MADKSAAPVKEEAAKVEKAEMSSETEFERTMKKVKEGMGIRYPVDFCLSMFLLCPLA